MRELLEEVKRDAIAKRRGAVLEQGVAELLVESAVRIAFLKMIVRKEGLLGMEDMGPGEYNELWDLLREGISLVVDGTEPEYLEECLTTRYWLRDPKGYLASAYYIVIRGVFLLVEDVNPRVMELLLEMFLPEEERGKYHERIEERLKDYREERQTAALARFPEMRYTPKESAVERQLARLEGKLLTIPEEDVVRLLKELENEHISQLLCALTEQAQNIFLDHMSSRLASLMKEDAVEKFYGLDDEAIRKAAEAVETAIGKLCLSD